LEIITPNVPRKTSTNNRLRKAKKPLPVVNIKVIIGEFDRLRATAQNLIKYYKECVAKGSLFANKAVFVCASCYIIYGLCKFIIALCPNWTRKNTCADGMN